MCACMYVCVCVRVSQPIYIATNMCVCEVCVCVCEVCVCAALYETQRVSLYPWIFISNFLCVYVYVSSQYLRSRCG